MFCPACGNPGGESANFCEKCGADCRRNKPTPSKPPTFEQFFAMAKKKREDRSVAIGVGTDRTDKQHIISSFIYHRLNNLHDVN